MKTESDQIAALFAEMQKAYLSFGSMLETAESMLKQQDWISVSPREYCLSNTGGKLSRPWQWLPRSFTRMYYSAQLPRTLTFVSIRIDLAPDSEDGADQALMSGGALRYQAEGGWGDGFQPAKSNLAMWHLLRNDRQYDGKFHRHESPFRWISQNLPDGWKKETAAIAAAATMARPLHDFRQSDDLQTLLIAPLLMHAKRLEGC